MIKLHDFVARRTLLKRMGALGTLLVLGALGVACTPKAEQQDTAEKATDTDTAPATAAGTTEAAPAAAEQPVPVNVDYLPNPLAAPPLNRTTNETVKVALEVKEVQGKLSDGAAYTYWTFGGTVPGPMLRVLQGDTVEVTLSNPADSLVGHNIDLHAVTGPGGGASLTDVAVGETKSFSFKALHPGVYVYHCATAPIDLHISNGMYGLIVVEPPEGLAPVDQELYICQGEIYTPNPAGTPGAQVWDPAAMSREQASHVVFNGAMGTIAGPRAFKAKTGDRLRIFFGVGGPNYTSSFHVIGEIFDRVATWGSLTSLAENVQTVSVAPGGATMVEFDVQVPGTYNIVDHALSRLTKGAAGQIVVEGPDAPDIYKPL